MGLEFPHVPLGPPCRCGSHFGTYFQSGSHIGLKCSECNVRVGGNSKWYSKAEVFKTTETRRSSMYVPTERIRFDVLKRDGHRCVYCGAGAPSIVGIDTFLRTQLATLLGNEIEIDHRTSCAHCTQPLPGMLSIFPYDYILMLSNDDRERLALMIHQMHLEVEHPFSVKLITNAHLQREDQLFVTREFLVTLCYRCNIGKSDRLISLDDAENLYRTIVWDKNDRSKLELALRRIQSTHLALPNG